MVLLGEISIAVERASQIVKINARQLTQPTMVVRGPLSAQIGPPVRPGGPAAAPTGQPDTAWLSGLACWVCRLSCSVARYATGSLSFCRALASDAGPTLVPRVVDSCGPVMSCLFHLKVSDAHAYSTQPNTQRRTCPGISTLPHDPRASTILTGVPCRSVCRTGD